MLGFVEDHAGAVRGNHTRAWALTHATLDPYILHFSYDPQTTLTASDAFAERRGNCLSFSAMFVAMAREAGLDARFQEVVIPPKWSAVNDTLLVNKHVNAVVSERGSRYIIDVSRRERMPREQSRLLSDSEAEAQYYNNLGAEALVAGRLPEAYAHFRKALETHPGLDYVWSNLGVVFRRNGQVGDAIFAYRTALEANPDHAVALNNLHSIYSEEGRTEEAQRLERRVERNRRNNPYYLHHLAEVAYEEQRFGDAIELLDRAIGIEANEYRFYFTLAQAQRRTGQHDRARASLERARELAAHASPESPPELPESP